MIDYVHIQVSTVLQSWVRRSLSHISNNHRTYFRWCDFVELCPTFMHSSLLLLVVCMPFSFLAALMLSLSLSFSFLPFIRTKWLRTVWLTQPESCLKRNIVTDLVLILHKKKAATLMRNSWSHSGCLCKLRSFLQTKAILSTSPSTTTEKCIALHFI